jgi:uncharacterized protein
MRAEVLVATTWRCNLRCSYCFVEQTHLTGGGPRMTPELAGRVVDALDEGLAGEVETICLHLYGGEPLTNLPALRALVERAEAKPPGRFTFAITTNGTRGTPEAVELLGRGRFAVVLSVDGPAEVHDECRRTTGGRPTHERVMRFLEDLRERTACNLRVSAVVRSGWPLSEAVEYLESLPANALKAQAVRTPEGLPWTLTSEERERYLQDLELLGRKVIADLEADRPPRDDRFSARVLQLLAGVERETFCAAGDPNLGITPSGDVLPCVLLDAGERLGHVDDDPAVWRQAGRRWRAERARRRPECEGCAALPLCGGGCPAILPVCGADECDLIRRNCEVAGSIYRHFEDRPELLLNLAGW